MGNKIAIILALVLGAMAVFLVQSHLKKAKAEMVGEKIAIVAARVEISKGQEIKLENLTRRLVPKQFLRQSNVYMPWNAHGRLLGSTSRYEIKPGEFLHDRLVIQKDEASGGLRVRENMRAYTISASGDKAVAGLLGVRDRVDIMGTFLILGTEAGLSGARTEKARTMFLMRDIEIMALDKTTRGPVVGTFSSLTFQLADVECLVLEFAQNTGQIRLVKRSKKERLVKFDEKERIEVHRENLMEFIKSASRLRANMQADDTRDN